MLHAILAAGVGLGALILFVILPLNFAFTPRLSRQRLRPVRAPRVSIVIPARDEERDIERTVRSHLTQDYSDFEVIVVEDRSSDRTGKILAALAREDARLTVVAGSEPPAGWLGKPHALDLGARAATGDLLLFADADVVYEPRTLREAVALLEERRLDFLAFLPRMEAEGFWESVLMPYVLGAYFGGIGFLANVDRPRWVAAGGGAGNVIRRSAYEALGGHAALKDSVIDDVHLALKAKRAGLRARAVRAEDRVSVRMYHGLAGVVNGFTKNMVYTLNGLLGVVLLILTAAVTVLWVAPAVGRSRCRARRCAGSGAGPAPRGGGLRAHGRGAARRRGSPRRQALARGHSPYNGRNLGFHRLSFPVSPDCAKAARLARPRV